MNNSSFEILKWRGLVDKLAESEEPEKYEPLESEEEEDLKSKKGKGKITKQKVLDWFKENPDPDDDSVHAWADDMGWDHHELEEMIYRIVTEYSKEEKEEDE